MLSVHSRLHNPTRDRLKALVHTAVGLSTLLYLVLGLGGLAVCRDVPLDETQDALSCLAYVSAATPGGDPFLSGCASAFGVAILLNTPAIIIPLRDSLTTLPNVLGFRRPPRTSPADLRASERSRLTTPTKPSANGDDLEDADAQGQNDALFKKRGLAAYLQHVALTVVLVVLSWAGATYAPGVAVVWAFAGSSVGLFISYTLPTALYLRVRHNKPSHKLLLCRGILALSLLLMFACLVRNIVLAIIPHDD